MKLLKSECTLIGNSMKLLKCGHVIVRCASEPMCVLFARLNDMVILHPLG